MTERPPVVPVVAAFLSLAALIAAVVPISLVFPGTLLDGIWVFNRPADAALHSLGRVAGPLIAVAGVASVQLR